MANFDQHLTHNAPIEIPGIPGSDLTRISAAEVASLEEYFRSLDDSRFTLTSEAVRERLEGLNISSALGSIIATLPERNLEFGQAVFAAYASSPWHAERRDAATRINRLTQLDHESGYFIWERLARDEDSDTRGCAVEDVRSCLEGPLGSPETPNTRLPDLGITWQEAKHLLDRHDRAERGEDLFRIERPTNYDEELYILKLRVSGYLAYLKVAGLAIPGDR